MALKPTVTVETVFPDFPPGSPGGKRPFPPILIDTVTPRNIPPHESKI